MTRRLPTAWETFQKFELMAHEPACGLREFTPRSERVAPAHPALRSKVSLTGGLLDVQQGDGFGTPGQAVPAKTQKAAKRKTRIPPPPNDPARGLFADAMEEACRLKRKHRALFNANPKEFRQQVKKAASRVFRLKPGPKQERQDRGSGPRKSAWRRMGATLR